MKLGRFTSIDLRDCWKHEALDFTQWLAKPENIELLSEEIGIGIQVIQTEAVVGRFNVDILAEEENTGRKIIIENQLESTDHSHLGQLITYASGLEAEFVIWIVREAKEEHTQAVDWLNEHTDEHINFFLVAIELWRIDDSPPAPRFNIVSRPNEWKRSIRTNDQSGDVSEIKLKQLEFWQRFKEYAVPKHPELKLTITPRPQHWFSFSIGRSDCHVSMVVNSQKNRVGCEIYIPDSKELYHYFFAHKDEVEKQLREDGFKEELNWQELSHRKASCIRMFYPLDFEDMSAWGTAFEWLADTASKLSSVFTKI